MRRIVFQIFCVIFFRMVLLPLSFKCKLSLRIPYSRFATRTVHSVEAACKSAVSCCAYEKSFPFLTMAQWTTLDKLAFEIKEWNQKVNLVSRKDIVDLVPNHIITALTISLVRRFGCGDTVVDVGTGGGLPGLPMAIACPDAQFTLIDSCGKKTKIVSELVQTLKLQNVRVVTSRTEDFRDTFTYMIGRGVSAVPTFLDMSQHLLEPPPRPSSSSSSATTLTSMNDHSAAVGGGLLYIKGGDFRAEVHKAGIRRYSLHPLTQLMGLLSKKSGDDGLSETGEQQQGDIEEEDDPMSVMARSDKSVLYIPMAEIVARREAAASAAISNRKRRM